MTVELEIMQQALMTFARSPPGTTVGGLSSTSVSLLLLMTRRSKWLIVDATLEASGAPIYELDGTLGLDRRNCRVHILWHHIS